MPVKPLQSSTAPVSLNINSGDDSEMFDMTKVSPRITSVSRLSMLAIAKATVLQGCATDPHPGTSEPADVTTPCTGANDATQQVTNASNRHKPNNLSSVILSSQRSRKEVTVERAGQTKELPVGEADCSSSEADHISSSSTAAFTRAVRVTKSSSAGGVLHGTIGLRSFGSESNIASAQCLFI